MPIPHLIYRKCSVSVDFICISVLDVLFCDSDDNADKGKIQFGMPYKEVEGFEGVEFKAILLHRELVSSEEDIIIKLIIEDDVFEKRKVRNSIFTSFN